MLLTPPHTPSTLVQVYFKGGALEVGLKDLKGKKRAFIVTDKPLFDMGYADKVTNILDQINIQHQVWGSVGKCEHTAIVGQVGDFGRGRETGL